MSKLRLSEVVSLSQVTAGIRLGSGPVSFFLKTVQTGRTLERGRGAGESHAILTLGLSVFLALISVQQPRILIQL